MIRRKVVDRILAMRDSGPTDETEWSYVQAVFLPWAPELSRTGPDIAAFVQGMRVGVHLASEAVAKSQGAAE